MDSVPTYLCVHETLTGCVPSKIMEKRLKAEQNNVIRVRNDENVQFEKMKTFDKG